MQALEGDHHRLRTLLFPQGKSTEAWPSGDPVLAPDPRGLAVLLPKFVYARPGDGGWDPGPCCVWGASCGLSWVGAGLVGVESPAGMLRLLPGSWQLSRDLLLPRSAPDPAAWSVPAPTGSVPIPTWAPKAVDMQSHTQPHLCCGEAQVMDPLIRTATFSPRLCDPASRPAFRRSSRSNEADL